MNQSACQLLIRVFLHIAGYASSKHLEVNDWKGSKKLQASSLARVKRNFLPDQLLLRFLSPMPPYTRLLGPGMKEDKKRLGYGELNPELVRTITMKVIESHRCCHYTIPDI